jgi:hypothetical protein
MCVLVCACTLLHHEFGHTKALKEETRKMEDRLAMLRVAMSEEKAKWDSVHKQKDGSHWRAARSVDNPNYAEHVLDQQSRPRPPRRSRPASRGDNAGVLEDPYRRPLRSMDGAARAVPAGLWGALGTDTSARARKGVEVWKETGHVRGAHPALILVCTRAHTNAHAHAR